jgi:hypothetical protein
MASRPLPPADLQRFERDGYVVARQAFPAADALAMEERWWRELRDTHGIRRDDRSSWRAIPGNLKAAKRDPAHAAILTETVRGVFDDLLGPGTWSPPKDWGLAAVTFPAPGRWELPTHFWHSDNPCEPHLDRPRGLFVVSFIGPVAPRGGGTLILSGSPFMDRETLVEGVPLRVVELTGEPGDMVFCHPIMVHCGAPNRGVRPRFTRIKQQFLTHEGRAQFRAMI